MSRLDDRQDPLEQVLARLGTTEELRLTERVRFDRLADGATRVVIVGCGALSRWASDGARAAGIEIVAFADNDSSLWGGRPGGIPVMSPADAVDTYGDDAFFLVAIFNSAAVRAQLRSLGCRRIVPFAAFFWKYADSFRFQTGLDRPHRIRAAETAMRAGYQCLADARSRREFAAQVAWRCTLDDTYLSAPDPQSEIYFGSDVVRLRADEVLVDCGAFDGDSVRMFVERTLGTFDHAYACEPDPKNGLAFEASRARLPLPVRDRISLLPYAIGNSDGVVHFHASGTAGSHVGGTDATSPVVCRRLDTLLDGIVPTIIKMDIEGAEPEALLGATETIRRARPILAVCAYHACEHLWTLPVMLHSILPEYRISLRRYAEECWETVFYAVPPERAA